MWNKDKKVLKQAGSYIEEGMILLHPDFQMEILSDITYKFLKIDDENKFCHLFDIPKTSITKKIETMVTSNEDKGIIEYEEKSISIRVCAMDKGRCKLIILKDDSSLEKMLNMGKEFVGNASHELRTPITIIKGFTEMLLESEEIDEDTRKSILKKIEASCLRMEHLVNHLLRLTDLENTSLEALDAVDVHRLIEDISYQVISIYPEVRIEHLRTEDEAIGWIDSDLIELVLTNLFKNAVKYSRVKKVIIVKVDTSGDEIYIQIHDKGIGIPEKDLDRVFERFYTVDKAHCRKLGGAGLGLSIVRLIVNKHGGRIHATSIPGESTTMHLYLPKAKRPAPAALR